MHKFYVYNIKGTEILLSLHKNLKVWQKLFRICCASLKIKENLHKLLFANMNCNSLFSPYLASRAGATPLDNILRKFEHIPKCMIKKFLYPPRIMSTPLSSSLYSWYIFPHFFHSSILFWMHFFISLLALLWAFFCHAGKRERKFETQNELLMIYLMRTFH